MEESGSHDKMCLSTVMLAVMKAHKMKKCRQRKDEIQEAMNKTD